MKKFRPLILILVLITAFVLFLILYNPSISIGYYDGVVKNEAKDYPYEGRVGLFIKARASAARCFSPPLKEGGNLFAR